MNDGSKPGPSWRNADTIVTHEKAKLEHAEHLQREYDNDDAGDDVDQAVIVLQERHIACTESVEEQHEDKAEPNNEAQTVGDGEGGA